MVERASDAAEVQRRAGDAGVTLVIVAGDSAASGGDPLSGFRAPVNREFPVVALVSATNVEDAWSAGADEVITLPFDPATFAAEVSAVRRRR